MNNFDLMTKVLFDCKVEYLCRYFEQYKYPWLMVPEIKNIVSEIIESNPRGFTKYSDEVLIGENVEISPMATIIGPAVIGKDTKIRTGAFIRENVLIGENCVIGNSSEIKNCILLDNVQLPHYNYVGDSVVGNYVHLGAGAICSNLKTNGSYVSIHAHIEIKTGLRKLGAILGDGADIGCGSVLNPGTVIGRNTSVYPLTSVRGVVRPDSIVKSTENIVKRKEYI